MTETIEEARDRETLAHLANLDLQHELRHLRFYTQAGAMVQSPHRLEFREWLHEEASDELEHVKQFSTLIAQLGGVPVEEGLPLPVIDYGDIKAILTTIVEIESEVAERYSMRLRQTENHCNADVSNAHVFYEDQIADSWQTAQEARLMLSKF